MKFNYTKEFVCRLIFGKSGIPPFDRRKVDNIRARKEKSYFSNDPSKPGTWSKKKKNIIFNRISFKNQF